MWASAREELRRPGLRGGGVGKPLLAGAGLDGNTGLVATGGVASGAIFLVAVACTGLGVSFKTGLLTDLTLATTLAGASAVTALGKDLTIVFGSTFAGVLTDALALAFAGAALTTGLVTELFPAGLANFFAAGSAAGLAAGFGLATDLEIDLAGALGGDFGSGLAVILTTGLLALVFAALAVLADFTVLTASLALVAGLLALLTALADFAGFAFTACLL